MSTLVYKYRHIKKKHNRQLLKNVHYSKFSPFEINLAHRNGQDTNTFAEYGFWFNSYASKNACVIHKT